MKEKVTNIRLKDLAGHNILFGRIKGQELYSKLHSEISNYPESLIFCISLKGIEATDASYPRESVVSLAKTFKGEKGFFIKDIKPTDVDMLDNWDYGCDAKDQTLIVRFSEKEYKVLGPQIPESLKTLLDYVMQEEGEITTSKVASKFGITVQNASGRLKKLQSLGLILARKETAKSGGVEFVYTAIK